LMMPKTTPAINNSTNVPVKTNPETNLAAIKIAAALAKILKINLIALFLTYIKVACEQVIVKKKSYFVALLRPFTPYTKKSLWLNIRKNGKWKKLSLSFGLYGFGVGASYYFLQSENLFTGNFHFRLLFNLTLFGFQFLFHYLYYITIKEGA